jgi:dihydroxy-acid dehydratase
VFALDGVGLSDQVAVITDGQLSGLVNNGISVAEVSPEGAVGGPIGLVRDGDVIAVDLATRTIELEAAAEELARRRAQFSPAAAPPGCGWLSVYARSVGSLRRGATLGG